MDATWQRIPDLFAPEAAPEPEPTPLTALALSRGSEDSRPDSAHGHAGDMTYATAYSDGEAPPKPRVPKPATGLRKPAPVNAAAKRAMVAAKKRREVSRHVYSSNTQIEISKIIDTQLPLEYRGGDADARLCMEKVIGRLWDGDGLSSEYTVVPRLHAVGDMVKPPEMPHPKVNKCLIALVAKKLVGKTSAKVGCTRGEC